MIRYGSIFFVFIFFSNFSLTESIKTIKNINRIPITMSMKDIMNHIDFNKVSTVECLYIQQKAVDRVWSLQQSIQGLMSREYITFQDVDQLSMQVGSMKAMVIDFIEHGCGAIDFSLENIELMHTLARRTQGILQKIGAQALENDVSYMIDTMIIWQSAKVVDRKGVVRLLSIIQEMIYKHDEMYVTGYSVLLLIESALNIFLIGLIS